MCGVYRASTNPPKTAWARHLDQVMRDRGWSRVRLFEEVGEELGYGAKSRSGFLTLLVDREPTPPQAAVLARHFGEPEAGAVSEPSPEPSLAAAISELAAELRAAREERQATEERLRALEAAVALLTPRDGEAHPARTVPQNSAE